MREVDMVAKKSSFRVIICLILVCATILTVCLAVVGKSGAVEDKSTDISTDGLRTDTEITDYEENVDEISVPMLLGSETLRASAEDVVYLSDIPYLSGSNTAWGSILMDKTDTSGSRITLNMNGSWVSFDKGIYAHANSNIYYDLGEYGDYKYFTTYFGVNSTSNNKGDGVKFWVYTSNNNKDWTFQGDVSQTIMKSSNSCGYIKVDLTGWRYLRLQCYQVNNNASDHSCWADAKLVKEGYKEFITMTIDEFDAEIRSQYDRKNIIDDELELLVLQRYLVNKIGAYQLSQLYKYVEYADTFEWLFDDLNLMRTFINGGVPEGTWFNAFAVLSRLYHAYGDDLNDERLTAYNVPYKDIFAKQMFAISLIYSRQVAFWIKSSGNANPNTNISDPVVRYGIYKNLFLAGKLNAMYGRLEVEEMRLVVWGEFADDEAYWLNDYTRTSGKSLYAPYSFTFYKKTEPYEYRQAKYYGDNRKAYESKYKLSGYNIANDKYYPKTWMIMQNGGQCWEIAILANTILNVNGIPAYSVVQWPAGKTGHQAFLSPWMNGNGDLNWGLYNDAYGWDESRTINVDGDTRRLFTMRLPLGWGHGDYVTQKGQATYLFLGQAALNNYSAMCRAAAYMKLADSYSDVNKKEEIYKKAIDAQSIHFDAWLRLVDLYRTSITKTDGELAAFISEMCEKLKGYPLPMYDLHRRIVGLVKDSMYQISANGAKEQALNWANQNGGGVAKQMAGVLLGKTTQKTVTFSFSSTPANKLVFQAAAESDSSITWDYSIDGGKSWTTVYDSAYRILTHEEVDSLTAANDILVHIVGLPYTSANYFKVDLTNGDALTVMTCANNNEKTIRGANGNMEWRYVGDTIWTKNWTSMVCSGEVTVEVRNAANGQKLPGPAKKFTFTESESSPERTYISLGNATYAPSAYNCSSEDSSATSKYSAFDTLMLGGWVSKYDTAPYIDVQLNNPTYVSRVQWISATGRSDGIPINVDIHAGTNGTNFTQLVTRQSNLKAVGDYINIDFEPVYTKYLRIVFTKTTSVSGGKYMVQAGELAIFRDITKIASDIEVEFSTVNPTNQSVIATLRPAADVAIPETEGLTYNAAAGTYTYVFEESKRITLSYKNAAGTDATAVIDVDWIDKVAPKYNLVYDTTTPTKGDVTVVCNAFEMVTFIQDEGGSNYHTFTENGEYTFKLRDRAGNITEAVAVVNVIDHEIPEAKVSYLPKYETDYPVTVDILFTKRVELINDNGAFVDQGDGTAYKYIFRKNGSYELRFKDMVGNENSTILTVDWIRPGLAETFVVYESDEAIDADNQFNSTTTSGNVTATLTWDADDPVTILNNNGSNSYIFYENGIFEFKYEDSRHNIGYAVAEVNWIEKELPVTMVLFDKTTICKAPVKATFISEEKVSIINNGGSSVYNFTENGTFSFLYNYVTSEGKTVVGITHATVDWIDSTEPTAEISFNYDAKTDRDVVVKLIPSEPVTVTNNGGLLEYTFTDNGEFTFEFEDAVGLKGSKTVIVDWIDRALSGKVVYDITENTSGNVIASLIFDENMFVIEGEPTSHEFTDNGEYIFLYADNGGKRGAITASVNWITREAPQGTISYNVAAGVKVTSKDDLPVIATLTADKTVTVLNNNGLFTREFTSNGSFTFRFMDEAGNEGTATATVNCIDIAPEVWVEYSTVSQTAGPVVVTLKADRPIRVTNIPYSLTREVIYPDSSFTFAWADNEGHSGTKNVTVNWITRSLPHAKVSYSTTSATNGNVTATLSPVNVDVTVTEIHVLNKNNEIVSTIPASGNYYEFTDNQRIEFIFRDAAGNRGAVGAAVDWIDRTAPTATVGYDRDVLSSEPVIARISFDESGVIISDTEYPYTKNADGSYSITFEGNGARTVNFRDSAGNTGSVYIEVNCIDKELPIGTVTFDSTDITNGNVYARLTFTKPSSITNEDLSYIRHADGSYTVIITENGIKTVSFRDTSGNVNTVELSVTWIDRVRPEVDVAFSTTDFTIHDVTAYLTFSEPVTIIGNDVVCILGDDGVYSLLFNGNATKTVRFRDVAGNENVKAIKVDWIDRLFQSVSVSYDIEEPTGSDVVATLTFNCDVDILNLDVTAVRVSKGVYEITFTSNADYEIQFRDIDGYEGRVPVSVDWIVKEVPTAHIDYSTREYTNGDVLATIRFNDSSVKITSTHISFDYLGGGVYTMLFIENGSHVLEFADALGNKNTTTVAVTWIDKTAPTVKEIVYDSATATDRDVRATLVFDEEVYIEYNGEFAREAVKEYHLLFIDNGSVSIRFKDVAGNENSASVAVDWIDKLAPTVKYVAFDSMEPTSGQTIATLSFSEPVNVLTEIDYEKYGNVIRFTFVTSGTYVIEFADEAGNHGSQEIIVDWIYNKPPTAKITYSTTETTRDNVTVNLKFDVAVSIQASNTVLNKISNKEYSFIAFDNGQFDISCWDLFGNSNKFTVNVDWIDRTYKPHSVKYNTTSITTRDVVVTIECSEGIRGIVTDLINVRNEDGSYSIIIPENGDYSISVIHEDGGEGIFEVSVYWINKELDAVKLTYSTGETAAKNKTVNLDFVEDVTILNTDVDYVRNEDGSYTFKFQENGTYVVNFRYGDGHEDSVTITVDWIAPKLGKTTIIIIVVSVVCFVAIIAAIAIVLRKKREKHHVELVAEAATHSAHSTHEAAAGVGEGGEHHSHKQHQHLHNEHPNHEHVHHHSEE